jgi:hypothetical protein
VGSAASAYRAGRVCGRVSACDFLQVGSSLSLRSLARISGSCGLSVSGQNWIGSSLSVRSFVRVGSALSCVGVLAVGSLQRISLMDRVLLGSSCSVR